MASPLSITAFATRMVPSRRLIRRIAVATLIAGLAATALGWGALEYTRARLPAATDLTELKPDYGTRVQAADGTHLGGHRAVEPTPYGELPPRLVAAFLAAEDEDFFTHDGYNLRSIMRAAYENIRAGQTIQGASTITQQVAKHFLEPEKNWHRKIREFLLAREIEDRHDKPDILAAYLGGVYFGNSAWGITQASYTYFSKPPAELSTGQAATLAGLLPAPSVYNPIDNPNLARQERNRVLRRMHEIGVLTAEQLRRKAARPLEGPTTTPRPVSPAPEATNSVLRAFDDIGGGRDWEDSQLEVTTTHHPGLQSAMRRAIQRGVEAHDRRRGWRGPAGRATDPAQLDAALDELDEDRRFVFARIEAVDDDRLELRVPGGHTELKADQLNWVHGLEPDDGDSRAPDAAWDEPFEVDDVVMLRPSPDGPRLWQPPVHQGAGAAVDHHSGETLASVGAYDVDRSAFHRAEQACRQPGSLFKAVVFAEAFSDDVTPATLLSDVPTDIQTRDGVWRPRNADRDFSGYITAVDALVFSRNIPTANLAEHLGVSRIVDRAEQMGVDSPLTPTLALALGASCTKLTEMLDVYATIGREGRASNRRFVSTVRDLSTGRIRDRGHFLERGPELIPRIVRAADRIRPADRPLERPVAVLMTDILRQVATRGTARDLPDEWPVAAKTGTSDDYDTWLATVDPRWTTTVWVGSDHSDDPFLSGEHAGTVALPVFEHFYAGMAPPATDDWPPGAGDFEGLEQVAVDPATGLRARPGEPAVNYLFLTGTAPREYAPTRATRQLEHFDSAVY